MIFFHSAPLSKNEAAKSAHETNFVLLSNIDNW